MCIRDRPCIDAVLQSGIKRVVVSTLDPDPRVSGGGVKALRAAGLQVDVGELAFEATRLNEAYLSYKTCGRPFVTAKAAISLDGRLATRRRESQWISGEIARRRTHQLRAETDAIGVGIGTVLDDDPRLTVRGGSSEGPRYRVVFDTNLRTPRTARMLSESGGRVLLFCGPAAPADAEAELGALDAEIVRVSSDGEGLSWDNILLSLIHI